jgi:integrase
LASGTVFWHGFALAHAYTKGVYAMPGKIPQPWYRKGRGWFVWINGKQHALGKDRDEAFRRFHLLMAGEVPTPKAKPEPTPEPKETLTVGQLVQRYLADAQRRMAPNTFRVVRDFAKSFAGAWDKLPADAVRKHHVEAWIGQHRTWGQTTEWDAKTRLVTLFHWAVDQELIPGNPIRRIHKPPVKSRGREALIAPEDHARLLAGASPALRNVLLVLHQTGARPGEVIRVSASEFYPEQGVWVLVKHKTAHKGRQRIIYLTPELTALCRELAARYPEGPIFRTSQGKPWCHTCYLAEQVRNLRKKLGVRGAIPYGYRHSFATDALANGVPDAQVAELLGHSGTAMLHRHYAHLTARAKALRSALAQIR